NWTLVHPIKKDSPLFGKSLEELKAMHTEILVMVTGFDESYNQTIHADSSYICTEILEGHRFKPMYQSTNGEATRLYLDDLDEVVAIG
ncbi:MAG: transporter, partial [Bacteroidota bacterium]